jgi:hypothetical protein
LAPHRDSIVDFLKLGGERTKGHSRLLLVQQVKNIKMLKGQPPDLFLENDRLLTKIKFGQGKNSN